MALLQISDFDNGVTDLDFIDEIKSSTSDVLFSRLGNETYSRIGRLKQNRYVKANASGAWASGVTFTAHDQYLVYNDEAYVLDIAAVPPVVTGAAPDANFIKMVSITDITTDVFDDYNAQNLHNYTTLTFKDQQDMENLVNLDGKLVTVEIGDSLKVSDSVGMYVPYIVIDFASINPGDVTVPLINGLYAKEISYALDPAKRNPLFNLDKDNDAQNFREPDFKEVTNGIYISSNQNSACIGQDGNVYMVQDTVSPRNTLISINTKGRHKILEVTTSTNQINPLGGVTGCDGRIYIATTSYLDGEIVALDPKTGEEEILTFTPSGNKSYYGQPIACDNGIVYFFAQAFSDGEMTVLKVDCVNSLVTLTDFGVLGGGVLGNGCVTKEGNIMLATQYSDSFYEYNTTTDTFTAITGATFTPGVNTKIYYQTMKLGTDGFIYAIPFDEDYVIKIDSATLAVVDATYKLIPAASTGNAKIEACTTANSGLLYMSQGGNDRRFFSYNVEDNELKEYDFFFINTGTIENLCVDKFGGIIASNRTETVFITNLKDTSWTQSVYVAKA